MVFNESLKTRLTISVRAERARRASSLALSMRLSADAFCVVSLVSFADASFREGLNKSTDHAAAR
jgi:hypothetical protein